MNACSATAAVSAHPSTRCHESSVTPASETRPPPDHTQPEASAAATSAVAITPGFTSRSQSSGPKRRRQTRRIFTTSNPARTNASTSCTTNNQASPGDAANRLAMPLANSSATTSASPQSVPRGVTYGAYASGEPAQGDPRNDQPARHQQHQVQQRQSDSARAPQGGVECLKRRAEGE